jgi:hypothetical protein
MGFINDLLVIQTAFCIPVSGWSRLLLGILYINRRLLNWFQTGRTIVDINILLLSVLCSAQDKSERTKSVKALKLHVFSS